MSGRSQNRSAGSPTASPIRREHLVGGAPCRVETDRLVDCDHFRNEQKLGDSSRPLPVHSGIEGAVPDSDTNKGTPRG